MPYIEVGMRVGPYTVTKLLRDGTGGMASVCLAKPGEIDENIPSVALKITNPGRGAAEEREDVEELYHDALNNEVEILRKLRHPNIVRLLPVKSELRITPYIARATNLPGRPWFSVMEYLEGDSLACMLDEAPAGRLPLGLATEISYQIAQALEYIHLKEIAHLDVKPDNILFRKALQPGERPEVALIDFGIARREKQTGLKAGAVDYMAPERIKLVRNELEEKVSDQRPADVFSLGVLMYRSMAGKTPFAKRDRSTTTQTILKEEPIPLSRYVKDVPPAMEDIIMRCMVKDPRRRATIPEVLAALDEAVPPPRIIVKTTMPTQEKGRSGKPAGLAIVFGLLGWLVAAAIIGLVILGTLQDASSAASLPPPVISTISAPTEVQRPPIVTPTAIRTATPPPTVTPFPTYTPVAGSNLPRPSRASSEANLRVSAGLQLK